MRRKLHVGIVFALGTALLSGCAADAEQGTTEGLQEAAEAPAPDQRVVETELGEVEILAYNFQAPWSIAFAEQTPLISERHHES